MITAKGRKLYYDLRDAGMSEDSTYGQTQLVCSLICRNAVALERVNEGRCNGYPCRGNSRIPIAECNRLQAEHDAYLDKTEARAEKRIRELVAMLPPMVNGERITVDLSNGDPRGYAVKLVIPGADNRSFNSWEHGIIGVEVK